MAAPFRGRIEADSSFTNDENASEPHRNVWLASWPRSGNTWFRIVLNDCFGSTTASIYGDNFDAFPSGFGTALGRGRPNRFGLTKTHEALPDSGPAIYLVRDGRAAVVSYFYFCQVYDTARTMEEVIVGWPPFGSWSEHLQAWNPRHRPDTLLLRFEDITECPEQAIETVSVFLNCRPMGKLRHTFSAMNELEPRFFRSGSNRLNISELTDKQLELFETLHGTTLRDYGYG